MTTPYGVTGCRCNPVDPSGSHDDAWTDNPHCPYHGECNGVCLSGSDLGVPEFGGITYAHPDCPEHGYPEEERFEEEGVCGYGAEDLRYVREEDMSQ